MGALLRRNRVTKAFPYSVGCGAYLTFRLAVADYNQTPGTNPRLMENQVPLSAKPIE